MSALKQQLADGLSRMDDLCERRLREARQAAEQQVGRRWMVGPTGISCSVGEGGLKEVYDELVFFSVVLLFACNYPENRKDSGSPISHSMGTGKTALF